MELSRGNEGLHPPTPPPSQPFRRPVISHNPWQPSISMIPTDLNSLGPSPINSPPDISLDKPRQPPKNLNNFQQALTSLGIPQLGVLGCLPNNKLSSSLHIAAAAAHAPLMTHEIDTMMKHTTGKECYVNP